MSPAGFTKEDDARFEEAVKKHFDVAHQQHYEGQSIQPIEYMQATLSPEEFKGFLKANVIKYVSRAERKNGVEDYEKALVYAGWLVTAARGEKVKP